MTESDHQFALLLQEQFNQEIQIDNPTETFVYSQPKNAPNHAKSLTDPSWELIDPTPNVYVLFVAFNEKYFWNKLVTVSVSWSKRMTTCAGICSYQGRGGLCHITLSEPLLKLRPRKDLIETLLHEMIHAYLFVTHNNRDRDGHGAEFHKHMYRINAEAGTNITVYHSFHDEVRLYKQHWWKCNGPCQHRPPYYGTVKRAMNRAPGPNDTWWATHLQNCGGTFIKIKEPDNNPKKKSQKENKNIKERNDIRKFYPVLNENDCSAVKTNVDDKSNDVQLAEITNDNNNIAQQKPITAFEGKGHVLAASSRHESDYSAVRNAWLNKFPQSTGSKRNASNSSNMINNSKHRKIETSTNTGNMSERLTNCPVCDCNVSEDEINAHLDLCLIKSNSDFNKNIESSTCFICNKVLTSNLVAHLDKCMIENNIINKESDTVKIRTDNGGDLEKKYNCPLCFKLFLFKDISSHMDMCLKEEETNQNDSIIEIFDEPF